MKRILLLGLVGMACSDQHPFAPETFGRVPCRPPPALVAMVIGPPFAPQAMQSALLHAAGPMSTPLGAATAVREMQDAIRLVAADIGSAKYDGACRLLAIAAVRLDGLPEAAATYADRDGIRLVLALTAQALAAEMSK